MNKRSITNPVTYGDSTPVAGQVYVPKRGMKCALWWERVLPNGKKLYLCCYRDGLGKVVLLHTTHEMFGPGKGVFQFNAA